MLRPLPLRFVSCALIALTSCSDHEPLVLGGSGRGKLAEMTAGGLKWDAQGTVRYDGAAFEITNQDDIGWRDVTLGVTVTGQDSGYTLKVNEMAAGRTYTASCSLFTDDKGRSFDPQRERPRSFYIDCIRANGKTSGGFEAAWPADSDQR